MDKTIAGLLVLHTLLAGCAVYSGKPSAMPQPPSVTTRYTVQNNVAYTPADWPQQLSADVYVPDGSDIFPAALMVHGGGWVGGERSIMKRLSERLARRGYVVVNVDYRLAPQFHHPAQIDDLRQALRWMRTNAARLKLDPERVGAWGYSAGAHLVALLGTDGEAPATQIKAVVAGGLPSDLSDFPNGRLALALMGVTRDADPVAWRQASPFSLASTGDAAMFIYHGTWDTTVSVKQARKMNTALEAARVPVELYLLQGSGHNTTFLFGFSAEGAAIDFLDRYLRQ
jgi:acetyl esterase/lipase